MIDWRADSAVWLSAGGKRLEARVWGPPPDQAPTLLLLHEGLGAANMWRGVPAALAARTGCGVLAYSRAGYGQSDAADLPRPVDYMSREALDVLPEILDQIGLRQGLLVGHSDGATIAAIHAGHLRDDRLRGLVLIAPHFFTEPVGLAAIADAGRAYRSTDLKERLARHHKDPDNAFIGWNDAWLNPDFKDWNVEDVIAPILVPVLAIQGLDDQYGTLAQIKALDAKLTVPLKKVLLKDCRHSPHIEQPEKMVTAVADFVSGLVFDAL